MGINDCKYMGGGRNVKDYLGSHVLELVEFEGGTNYQNREKVIARFNVRGSTNADLAAELEGAAGEVKVGDPIVMNEYPDYFYTDVRNMLGALVDENPADDTVDWATFKEEAEAGKFNGQLIGAEVWSTGKVAKKGKRAGQTMNDVSYSAPPKD